MLNFHNVGKKKYKAADISSELFRLHWGMYRKILRDNYMSHSQAYGKLYEILTEEMNRPFTFADLACGDAFYSIRTLEGTEVVKYVGIDLSDEALSLAKEGMNHLHLEKHSIKADFEDFDRYVDAPPDLVWVGLSIHHLDTDEKTRFMKKVKKTLNIDGLFLIYEPGFLDDEDRGTYFERFKRIYDSVWKDLMPEERVMLLFHVRKTEKPETVEDWIRIGKDAGFETAEAVFSERTGLYTLFKFK